MTTPHAKISDLPCWPCPPRVRDIPDTPHSWGKIAVYEWQTAVKPPVAYDELGYLWVCGDTVLRFQNPHDPNSIAVVFWTDSGIGLWVHPQSLAHLASASRLDMAPGEWLPVTVVSAELPSFVKE